MMDHNATELSTKIRAVFSDDPPVGFPIAPHQCGECARIEADFHGKCWSEVSLDTLKYHFDSLPLLSPEAFKYYLPAFMLGAIADPESNLPEFLMYSLLPNQLARRERCRFSAEQEQAIVEFARWMAWSPESEQIEAYWSNAKRF
jgi:hypothetical protein